MTAGSDLEALIRADLKAEGLELDAKEEALLGLARSLTDRMEALNDLIEAEGLSRVSDSGMVRIHPAVPEVRQHAAAVAKCLAGIALDDGAAKDPQKVRAAQSRWRDHVRSSGKGAL